MITTKVEIGGTQFDDYQRLRISKSMNDFNSVSKFEVVYDSPFGRHSTDFSVGQIIDVYADESDATTKIFSGVLEKVRFKGKGASQRVILSGRDFTLRLLDSTVEPVVFTDTNIEDIVKTIVGANTDDITTAGVTATGTNLKRIAFNHLGLFDALKQLANLAGANGFYFYVDENKDLKFIARDSVSSGITLNNTNIKSTTLNKTREGMVNEVYVYGDRQLAGFTETLSFNGGSVVTLLNRPRNTSVNYLGSPLKGGVFELTETPASGTHFLVDYFDSQIIFTSGTAIGNNIPTSGESGLFSYDRDIPIVKATRDAASINTYGLKRKIITDKAIKDPNTAIDIMNQEISKSNPLQGMEIKIKGWFDFTIGETVDVVLSDFNINDTVGILSVDYVFDKNTVNSEEIINVRLDTKIRDITDEITDMRKRLDFIEAGDRSEADQITRLETATGSVGVVGSRWNIFTNEIRASFILGHSVNGVIGSPATAVNGSQVILGDVRTAFSLVASGGYY